MNKLKYFILLIISLFRQNLYCEKSVYEMFEKYYFYDIGSDKTLKIKFDLYQFHSIDTIFKNLSNEELVYLNVFLNNTTSFIKELYKRQNILKTFIGMINNNEIEYNSDFLIFTNPYFNSLLDIDIENLTNREILYRLKLLKNLIKKIYLIIKICESNTTLSEIFEKEIAMFYNLVNANTEDNLLNTTIEYIKNNMLKEELCAKNYIRKKYVICIKNNYEYFIKIIYHLSKIMFYLKISYNIVSLNKDIQFVNFKKYVDERYIDAEKNKVYNDNIKESYTFILPKNLNDDIILKHFYKSFEKSYNKNKLKENAFLGLVFGFVIL